ncbi:hypothetical protein Gogos_002771 [Gossypium gossypioides]|uniref:Uncharacterized protein n=1 Tax=Gossypium gossypioides TaxID=34282 RepID=A0A7J9CJT9_GOSGO|nr:hypothetical protein [Gossypium gossypioides]
MGSTHRVGAIVTIFWHAYSKQGVGLRVLSESFGSCCS